MGYQLRRLVAWHGRAKGWAHAVVNEIADMVRDDDPTGPAWPGIARLSRVLGCDSRTVRRAIQEAVKAGDIKCEAKSGAPNRYTLTPKLLSLCQGGQPDSTANVSPLPGQPDRGVLSESPGGTVTLTPEPQENHKGTTNQPPVVADIGNDTGPIPFSEPDSFTRAARRAGIGSQPSKRVAVAKQKSAAQFDLGELEHAPAIKVHRDVCGYVPMTPEQARQIVAGVNGDAETTWRANLNFWMAQGYRANNIDGQTERHATEKRRASARATQPAAAKIGGWQPAKGMYPQVPDRTPEQMAEIHRQDLERTAARRAAQVDVIDHSKTTEVPF